MSTLQGGRRSLLLTALLTCLLGGKVPAQQHSGQARLVSVSLGRFLAGHSPHPAPRPGLFYSLAPYRETHPVPENSSSLPRQGIGSRESCEPGTVPLLWASDYTSMKSDGQMADLKPREPFLISKGLAYPSGHGPLLL